MRKTISNGGRTELEVSNTDPNKLFVLVQKRGANPIEILSTDDAFTTSISLALPRDLDSGIPDEDFTRGQSSYNLTIAIDPKNDNVLYVGGIDLFKTANSNEPDGNLVKWNQLTHWFGGYGLQEVHAGFLKRISILLLVKNKLFPFNCLLDCILLKFIVKTGYLVRKK